MAKDNSHILKAIYDEPWAITPQGLSMIIAVAERSVSDIEAANRISAERIEAANNIGATRKGNSGYSATGSVAVIPIFGPIIPRADFFATVSGITSAQRISAQLDEALADPDISAIVLNVDSPGGQVTGINELGDKIFSARDTKPIAAYVNGQASSAGYWLASAAGSVILDRTAQVGCLGVCAAWEDDSANREGKGFKRHQIVSSQTPKKNLDPATAEGRKIVQEKLDALAAIFIDVVARNRGVDAATVAKDFGQGDTLVGEDAVSAGMADGIGSLDSVIASAIESATTDLLTKGMMMSGKTESTTEPKAVEPTATVVQPAAQPMTPEQYKASNPEGYDAIYASGALHERNRIQSIDDIGIDGFDAMISAAKYTAPITAEALSVQILKAQKKKTNDHIEGYKKDATSMTVISASPGDGGEKGAVHSEAESVMEQAGALISRHQKGTRAWNTIGNGSAK